MAKVEHVQEFHKGIKIVRRTFSGHVTVDDILDSFVYLINNGMSDEDCKGILTDLRGCTLNFEMNSFQNMLEYIRTSTALRGKRIAVVVDNSNNIVFPMIASKEPGIEVEPFSTMEAAYGWIMM